MPKSGKSEIRTAQDWAKANRSSQAIAYVLILGCIMTFAMGQTILFTVLGPVSRVIGMPEYQVGLIVTLSALAMVIVQPSWGRLSDVWGRKIVIIFGLGAYSITTVIFTVLLQFGLSESIALLPLFGLLVIARVAYALTSSGIQPAATAYIADTTTGTQRSAGVALIGAAVGIGTVGGPILAFLLVGFGILVPLYAAAGIAMTMAVVAVVFLREPPSHVRSKPTVRMRLLDRRVMPYLAITMVLLTITAMTQQTGTFYVQDRLQLNAEATARAFGIAMGLTAIVTIIVQGVVVQWLRPAPAVLVRVGLLLGTTAFVFLANTKAYEGLVIGYMILGGSFGLLNPGLMSAASLCVGPDEQGSVAGLIGSAMSAGFVFGPILGTSLYQWMPVAPLWLNATGMALMLIASGFLYFAPRPAHLQRKSRD